MAAPFDGLAPVWMASPFQWAKARLKVWMADAVYRFMRFKLFETTINHIKQIQTTSNHLKPYQTISNNLKPPQTISNNLKPPQTISNNFKPPETISNNFKPPETTSNNIIAFHQVFKLFFVSFIAIQKKSSTFAENYNV